MSVNPLDPALAKRTERILNSATSSTGFPAKNCSKVVCKSALSVESSIGTGVIGAIGNTSSASEALAVTITSNSILISAKKRSKLVQRSQFGRYWFERILTKFLVPQSSFFSLLRIFFRFNLISNFIFRFIFLLSCFFDISKISRRFSIHFEINLRTSQRSVATRIEIEKGKNQLDSSRKLTRSISSRHFEAQLVISLIYYSITSASSLPYFLIAFSVNHNRMFSRSWTGSSQHSQ